MSGNQSFAHPPLSKIQSYLNARDKSVDPPKITDHLATYLGVTAFSSLLLFSWFYAVNPTGVARRITYEKSLPFPLRILKLSSPFIIILGGMYATDKNLWFWSKRQ